MAVVQVAVVGRAVDRVKAWVATQDPKQLDPWGPVFAPNVEKNRRINEGSPAWRAPALSVGQRWFANNQQNNERSMQCQEEMEQDQEERER